MGVGGAAALASFRLQDSEAARAGRPNVLWVITDDHPQYMMESLPVTTDNIRDLGIEFTLGSADVPLCGPARVSLLTGLSVTTHKCDTNRTWSKFLNSTLGLQERTVARYMQDVGYATGHFCKYINGYGNDGTKPPYWNRWRATKGDASDAGDNVTTPNQGNVDGTWIDIVGPTSVLVNHTDLMPTTCELAGVTFPSADQVDGRSMLPYLGANSFSDWRKRMLITGSNDVGGS